MKTFFLSFFSVLVLTACGAALIPPSDPEAPKPADPVLQDNLDDALETLDELETLGIH